VTSRTRRERLVFKGTRLPFRSSAIEISDSGRAHPEGLEEGLLEPFGSYCALLRRLGCLPTVPAAAVEVALAEHRWALVTALRQGLDFERWMAEQGDAADAEGAKQRRKAQRRVRQIEGSSLPLDWRTCCALT
jgi:hypothetical protein